MTIRRVVGLAVVAALCTRRGRQAVGNLLFTLGLELMPMEGRAEEARRHGRARFERDVQRCMATHGRTVGHCRGKGPI